MCADTARHHPAHARNHPAARRRPDSLLDASGRIMGVPGVIGLVVGRSLLYRPGDDVAAAVDTAVGLLPQQVTV